MARVDLMAAAATPHWRPRPTFAKFYTGLQMKMVIRSAGGSYDTTAARRAPHRPPHSRQTRACCR